MNDFSIRPVSTQNQVNAAQAPLSRQPEKPTFERALALIQSQSYIEAKSMLEQLANEGNADAQNMLGDMYFCGIGVEQDSQTAEHYYQLAVNKDHAAACINRGYVLMLSLGKTFSSYLEMAAQLHGINQLAFDSSDGCQEIGFFYQRHNINYIASLAWYKKAAEPKISDKHQARLTQRIKDLHKTILESALTHLDNQDYISAYKELFLLANEGDSQAQFHLGKMYAAGLGVEQNFNTAMTWLAKNGKKEACNLIGVMYYEGRLGNGQNYKSAEFWFNKANHQGLTPTTKYDNTPSAWKGWYRLKEAKDAGSTIAAQQLKNLEEEKIEGALTTIAESDQSRSARRILTFLAEQRNANAQFHLGKIYLNAKPRREKNLDKAIKYLTQAFKNKHPDALLMLAKAHYAKYKDSFWGHFRPDVKIERAREESVGAASYRIAKILIADGGQSDSIAVFFLIAYENGYKPLLSDKDAIDTIFTLSEQYRGEAKDRSELLQGAEPLLKIAIEAKHEKAMAKQLALETEYEVKVKEQLKLKMPDLDKVERRQRVDKNNTVVQPNAKSHEKRMVVDKRGKKTL